MLFSASKIEPMKLRQKTLLIIGVTFVILIGIIYSTLATILHRDFTQFEQRETYKQIKRVQEALSHEVQLNQTNRNWAELHKTYKFINNANKAYTIKDIYGQPALIMGVAMPRHQQGGAIISYLILSVLVVGLVFSIVTLLLLEQLISSRLSHLVNHLRSIENINKFSVLQLITGKDELFQLADTNNVMLTALINSQNQQKDREERYYKYSQVLALTKSQTLDKGDLNARFREIIETAACTLEVERVSV